VDTFKHAAHELFEIEIRFRIYRSVQFPDRLAQD
jgi:hypothetical protein